MSNGTFGDDTFEDLPSGLRSHGGVESKGYGGVPPSNEVRVYDRKMRYSSRTVVGYLRRFKEFWFAKVDNYI